MTQLVVLVDYPISPVWLKYLELSQFDHNYQIIFVEIKITKKQKQAFLISSGLNLGDNITILEVSEIFGLFNLVKVVDRAIVIDLLASGIVSYALLNVAFRIKKCIIVKFLIGILPQISKKSLSSHMRSLLSLCEIFKFINQLSTVLTQRIIKYLIRYDYSVLGGVAAIELLPVHAGKLVYSCSFDFQDFCKSKEDIHDDFKYGVLIEENFVESSDSAFTGYSHVTDPVGYYKSLSEYMLKLEQLTGIPIKIIPHPKSNRKILQKYLNQFSFVNEASVVAVSKSCFVLTHMSTAISFALLAKKPILFIKCAGLGQQALDRMNEMASLLGIAVYDVNELCKLVELGIETLMPSENRRLAYIENFVCHPNAQLLSFNAVVRYVHNDVCCSDRPF